MTPQAFIPQLTSRGQNWPLVPACASASDFRGEKDSSSKLRTLFYLNLRGDKKDSATKTLFIWCDNNLMKENTYGQD